MDNRYIKWDEKYRPRTLSEMVADRSIIDRISEIGKRKQHILLVGSPGIGKSTLAKIIVNDILDSEYIHINASKENGIDIIRNKVTNFISTKSLDSKIKVVILEEADGISDAGQDALRNVMDECLDNCIFILTANYSYRLKETTRSRCAKIDIKYSVTDYIRHIASILVKEGVTVDKYVLEYVKTFYPDFRSCLNSLQNRARDGVIHIDSVVLEAGDFENELWSAILQNGVFDVRRLIIENGENYDNDFQLLSKRLFNMVCSLDLDGAKKSKILIIIGDSLSSFKDAEDVEIHFFTSILKIREIIKQ